jgi:hypothetical protein
MSNPAAIAGERYRLAWQVIQGGDAVGALAGHITWMLGDNDWKRSVWRERAVPPDGKTFQTKTFDQYLLQPAREGLGLPTLLTVHKLCEADPKYGAKAIAMLRAEIGYYDERVKADHRGLLDELPRLPKHGEIGGGHTRADNVNSAEGGNSASYLAARIKRDHREVWAGYMAGEYRSVRAAALAAGIVREPLPLDHLRRWWQRASAEERALFRAEIANGAGFPPG